MQPAKNSARAAKAEMGKSLEHAEDEMAVGEVAGDHASAFAISAAMRAS